MKNPIKIVSDGTPLGTKVFDQNGNDITKGITAINWSIKATGEADATLTFMNADVDIVGELKDG